MISLLLILAVCFVAFTNGANANFKGVASLYGSGTLSFRGALALGTFSTFLGSIAAVFLAEGMLKKFSGKGIVDDSLLLDPSFTISVAFGAAITSFLATRFGFPVSTTHALVGALAGAGWMGSKGGEAGEQVHLGALGANFIYPLFLSPLIAIVLGAVFYRVLSELNLAPSNRNRYLDLAHCITGGAASFARGLNDTPKMAALLLLLRDVDKRIAILGVGVMIAVGAIFDARRVAETLGKKVTNMNPGQGFAANFVTAILVTTASFHSLPVSTTHVSVGALVGMGASTKQAKWRKILEIMLAWFTTVPCGAVMAIMSYEVVKYLLGT